jgi:hypothetical protein
MKFWPSRCVGAHTRTKIFAQPFPPASLNIYLSTHFSTVFPKVEETVRRDALFADTFRLCSQLGQAELPENAVRFERLRSECNAARQPRVRADAPKRGLLFV